MYLLKAKELSFSIEPKTSRKDLFVVILYVTQLKKIIQKMRKNWMHISERSIINFTEFCSFASPLS